MKVIVTGVEGSCLSDQLRRIGCEPIPLPALRILPAPEPEALQRAVREAASGAWDWVAFTSRHAVQAFLGAAWELGSDPTSWPGTRFACVGKATGEKGKTPETSQTQ